ncbi:MAG: flagellar basal body L-ring protein FlgH [Porticoccaceae bacterium]|jgi:flagellar L-ring protein precursor FlgH|nr:flagellar basal body L-ring protein FlgH [Porticoccaceae bacterium]
MNRLIIACILGSLLSACAANPRMMPTAEFSPIQPIPAKKSTQPTGSIFTNGRDLFGDLRSYQAAEIQVGDLITVLLNETTQASRTSGVSTSRESTNDAIGLKQKDSIVAKLGFGSGFFDGARTSGSVITSDGAGTAGQAASLTGSISAMVIEVLANGNLVIIGEKQLALTEGSEFIRVKGIIRPADIQPDNTVLSTRVAHAQISYQGTGDLANATTPSWGNKLLYKFWPF